MGFIKQLETTTFVNVDNDTLSKEIVCVYVPCFPVIPTALFLEDTLHLSSNLDELDIDFTAQPILDIVDNISDITLLLVSVDELPDKGSLYFEGELVEQSFEFNFSDISSLRYIASGSGLSYSSIKISLRPIPDPISEWSQLLTVIFDIPKSNSYYNAP